MFMSADFNNRLQLALIDQAFNLKMEGTPCQVCHQLRFLYPQFGDAYAATSNATWWPMAGALTSDALMLSIPSMNKIWQACNLSISSDDICILNKVTNKTRLPTCLHHRPRHCSDQVDAKSTDSDRHHSGKCIWYVVSKRAFQDWTIFVDTFWKRIRILSDSKACSNLSSKGKVLSLCFSKALSTGMYLGLDLPCPIFPMFPGSSLQKCYHETLALRSCSRWPQGTHLPQRYLHRTQRLMPRSSRCKNERNIPHCFFAWLKTLKPLQF